VPAPELSRPLGRLCGFGTHARQGPGDPHLGRLSKTREDIKTLFEFGELDDYVSFGGKGATRGRSLHSIFGVCRTSGGIMRSPFAGGCVCGAVRYECTSEPLLMTKCHCRDCQRTSGGPYSADVIVPISAFRVTKGTIQHFGTPSTGGGLNQRGFCPKCGSRLTGGESIEKGIIGLFASSLDDPSWFRPSLELFVADAQPWDPLDPSLPKYLQSVPSP
jgi:hypothetical protein